MADEYAQLKTLVTAMVDQGHLPEVLYKFRRIDDWLDRILKEKALWFADVSTFNDPFDGHIVLDTENTVDEVTNFLLSHPEEIPAGFGLHEARSRAQELLKDPQSWDTLINSSSQRQMRRWGVCCFSKEWDGILQWSHYAQNHEGVSLGFEVRRDPLFFVAPLNVSYVDQYPAFNYVRDPRKCAEALLMTKAADWAYEREVRIMKQPKGAFAFSPAALTEITFGIRTRDEDMERVRALVKAEGFENIRFYKARVAKKRYAIERDLILE